MALKWEYGGEGDWEAESAVGDPDGWGCGYAIDVLADGRFMVSPSEEIDPQGPPEPFASLAEAKAWCERKEAAIQSASA